MTPLIQIFSNQKCLPVEVVPANEHSSNFSHAVSEMEERAGHPASFIATNLAIIPLEGDLRIVVQG
ncbi:conserved hypothetical protein [Vibrio crassostreae]|uniref:Uncharacterized protein n=1 Tax=Vibrio crassostreae TaxID=246167 RepID=A0A822MVW5_9VIBR|nr:hypothetical protein [Vibrio crassostreae]TCN08822.1 hypothetical protein EDB35_106239 [Vibrio crassostreae]CAK3038237.1 conserved hypothetical protein [Vibrio crassostreae]CAK3544588.1 conserved hypothetical protein [Vibrio crassostreae]CAK3610534.1 conserved hypothetical protein [Vibrio crassostreae]CDT17441.1 conserved hypothetical protein [Vibrio crassostreae]